MLKKAGSRWSARTGCGTSPNAILDFSVSDCIWIGCGDEESASQSILKIDIGRFFIAIWERVEYLCLVSGTYRGFWDLIYPLSQQHSAGGIRGWREEMGKKRGKRMESEHVIQGWFLGIRSFPIHSDPSIHSIVILSVQQKHHGFITIKGPTGRLRISLYNTRYVFVSSLIHLVLTVDPQMSSFDDMQIIWILWIWSGSAGLRICLMSSALRQSQRNVSHTEGYTLFGHVACQAVDITLFRQVSLTPCKCIRALSYISNECRFSLAPCQHLSGICRAIPYLSTAASRSSLQPVMCYPGSGYSHWFQYDERQASTNT